jgi:hypothetical protein
VMAESSVNPDAFMGTRIRDGDVQRSACRRALDPTSANVQTACDSRSGSQVPRAAAHGYSV